MDDFTITPIMRDGRLVDFNVIPAAGSPCLPEPARAAVARAGNPVRQPDWHRIGRWPDDPRN